jgi:hypothetical protein
MNAINYAPIEINIKYEPNDFIQAWQVYRSSIRLTRWNRFFAGVLLVIGIFIFLYQGLQWYVLLIFIAALEAWFDLIGEINWRAYYFRQKNSKQQPFHVLVDDLGITFRGSTLEAKGKWADYKSFIEGKTVFLLVRDRGKFTIIPKRAFHDNTELSYFRNLARERLVK